MVAPAVAFYAGGKPNVRAAKDRDLTAVCPATIQGRSKMFLEGRETKDGIGFSPR